MSGKLVATMSQVPHDEQARTCSRRAMHSKDAAVQLLQHCALVVIALVAQNALRALQCSFAESKMPHVRHLLQLCCSRWCLRRSLRLFGWRAANKRVQQGPARAVNCTRLHVPRQHQRALKCAFVGHCEKQRREEDLQGGYVVNRQPAMLHRVVSASVTVLRHAISKTCTPVHV